MRRSTITALLAAALFASTLAIGPAQALADPLRMNVASGTVTDTTGNPVPGAIVDLYAWPSDAVLDGLVADQQVPRTHLATVTADSTGFYNIQMNAADLQAAATVGTVANLEVDSGDNSWFFDYDTATGTSLADSEATTGSAAASTAAPATGVNLAGTWGATTPDICAGYQYKKQMNRDWSSVGSTYIWDGATGVTGNFTYDKGQNSSLGIAFKATVSPTPNLTGGFSADGTRTDNANTKIPYPNRGTGYDIEYQTQWRTALYHGYCPNDPKPNKWQVRENSWIGGQKLIVETSPPSTANGICAQFLPGSPSAFQTSDAHATTWGGSLGLSMADIGFDASAQTGYDTNAVITYGFANATQTNYVCGTDTVPSNAKRVVVQTHRNP